MLAFAGGTDPFHPLWSLFAMVEWPLKPKLLQLVLLPAPGRGQFLLPIKLGPVAALSIAEIVAATWITLLGFGIYRLIF